MTDRQKKPIPRSDWLMALLAVPLAIVTVIAGFWNGAFLAGPEADPDGWALLGGFLAFVWFLIFGCVDGLTYGNRSAVLLSLPLIIAFVCAGFAVHDLAMDYRAKVADCTVTGSSTYMVDPTRGSAYWVTAHELDCDGHEAEVIERLDGQPSSIDGYDSDSGPDTVRAEYDPRGLLEARIDHIGRNPWPWVYATEGLVAFTIILRLVAARARVEDEEYDSRRRGRLE